MTHEMNIKGRNEEQYLIYRKDLPCTCAQEDLSILHGISNHDESFVRHPTPSFHSMIFYFTACRRRFLKKRTVACRTDHYLVDYPSMAIAMELLICSFRKINYLRINTYILYDINTLHYFSRIRDNINFQNFGCHIQNYN